jgi:NADH:ubiquinone oxidoreductase subunit E
MMINGVAYGSLTPEKAKEIVRNIRNNAAKGV